MAFFRIKTVKGRRYRTLEERYREGGKVKSRVLQNLGPVGGYSRKEADEKYREVLRENVYRFGKARPGERYAREAWAREQYHRRLDEQNHPGEQRPNQEMRDALERLRNATYDFHSAQDRYRVRQAADIREQHYKTHRSSPQYRAEQEQFSRKQQAEKELAAAKETTVPPAPPAEKSYPPKDTPTDEDETRHAHYQHNMQAERDEAEEEYSAWANAEDAKADAGGPQGNSGPGSAK